MEENNDGEESFLLQVVILLGTDPRTETREYVAIKPEMIGCTIVAFVAPDIFLIDKGNHYHNGIPLISWEEPNTSKQRALQYLQLFEICKAEAVINLGWPYDIPGPSEAGITTIPRPLYEGLQLDQLCRLIHMKLYGTVGDMKPKKKFKKYQT